MNSLRIIFRMLDTRLTAILSSLFLFNLIIGINPPIIIIAYSYLIPFLIALLEELKWNSYFYMTL